MIFSRKNLQCVSFAFILGLSQQAFAAKKSDPAAKNKSDLFFTLSIGPSWTSSGETQTFDLAPGIEKSYVPNKTTKMMATGELFVGLQKPLGDKLEGQLGLALGLTSPAKLSGEIWDDADPAFNNYNYEYQIQHTRLAIKGKLIGNWHLPVEPWVNLSLGLALNRAGQFTNSPTDPSAVMTPSFGNHSTWAFAYTFGFGVQRNFTDRWNAGIGYEFADLGRSSLNAAPGQTMGGGLTLSHLYTHSILVSVTFIK